VITSDTLSTLKVTFVGHHMAAQLFPLSQHIFSSLFLIPTHSLTHSLSLPLSLSLYGHCCLHSQSSNRFQTQTTQAKPSMPIQSVKWGGRRLARSISLRLSSPVCLPFLRLTASLGSVTDPYTLTGEYAYANDYKVRLRALTDHSKD